MKAVPFLARLVRKLAVSDVSMSEVAEAASASGMREPEAAKRLYREWLNDTVVAEGANGCRVAIRDPDGAFLAWAASRILDPFQVPMRAHDAARADRGDETALLFSEVRWRQEVAWARRMRGSDNDRIAVLAEMWLTAARRDVAKLFRGVVNVYADEGLAEPGYADSVFHMLAEDEILEGRVEDAHWRPLWLRFAEREFGRIINGMGRGQVVQLAARCRDAEWRERTARHRERQADGLRARRPALMVAVITAALERGLSSDDLVEAETSFIDAVRAGSLDLSDRQRDAGWRIFVERLDAWVGRAEPPGDAERLRRIEAIEHLPPTWSNCLPVAFREIGADDQRLLVAWFDAISRFRQRETPSDPAVDFGMWLVEALSRGR